MAFFLRRRGTRTDGTAAGSASTAAGAAVAERAMALAGDHRLRTPRPIPRPAGAVEVNTDVGMLWAPAGCGVITPALQLTGTWEAGDGDAMARALAPGMTVLDVGAHVGYFTILAARLVGPRGRVIAIEPAPHNFALLEANIAGAGLENVEAVNAAAWHTSGELDLALSASNTGDHRVGLADAGRQRIRVRAQAIDDLLDPDERVDFALLDTQGCEQSVIRGMRRCIARWRPWLQVEFWPAGIRALGDEPSEVLDAYRGLGYEISSLEGAADGYVAQAERTARGFVTLLLTPRERPRPPQTTTLSVCIPTHHGRRAPLERALTSVIDQVTPELRGRLSVIVSDNASHDGTRELMANLVDRHGELIRYRRSEDDQGPAANVARAVEMAPGAYVWLLGSDDELKPGAIARALELLDTHPGASGITVNKRNFDATMSAELPPDPPFLVPPRPDELRVYSDAETALTECGLAHGLISSQICHRGRWLDAAALDQPEPSSLAPHVQVIGRMVLANPRWLWCPDRLVRQRCDPATPIEYGYKRYTYLLEILADVTSVWTRLLGRRSAAYRSLLDRWCRFVLTPPLLVYYKSAPGHQLRDDCRMLVAFTRRAWRSPYFRRRSLGMLLVPHPLAARALRTWRHRRTGG